MRVLKIVGLGLAIWGLSLLWPEVNLALTPPVMVGMVIGIVVIAVMICVLRRHAGQSHHDGKGDGQNQSINLPHCLWVWTSRSGSRPVS